MMLMFRRFRFAAALYVPASIGSGCRSTASAGHRTSNHVWYHVGLCHRSPATSSPQVMQDVAVFGRGFAPVPSRAR